MGPPEDGTERINLEIFLNDLFPFGAPIPIVMPSLRMMGACPRQLQRMTSGGFLGLVMHFISGNPTTAKHDIIETPRLGGVTSVSYKSFQRLFLRL